MQKNSQIPKTSGITLEFMFSGLLKGPWDQAMDFSCLKESGINKFSLYHAGFKGLGSYFWGSQHFPETVATGDVETKPKSPLAGAASSSHAVFYPLPT